MKPLSVFIEFVLIFNLLLSCTCIYAQEEVSTKYKSSIQMGGYLKDLQSYIFSKDHEDFIAGNLIHNRLNFRYVPSSKLSIGLEIRNRIFWGEEIKLMPGFSNSLENPDEFLNMSVTWIDNPDLIFQSTIDRLWLLYTNKNFEARVGRQRINWGICTIWNPNDIFNTYNFLDFDYEERPGRDAVRFTQLFSPMTNAELVAVASKNTDQDATAAKYFFNEKNYDFQFIVGIYNKKITLGTGWSGSINTIGFKGEIQYFAPYLGEKSLINLAMEADYLFGKSWYINTGFLFCSDGLDKPQESLGTTAFKLTPKHLMPTKWNASLTLSKQISPLFSSSFTSIFAPGTNLLIILPSLTYNMFTNLDIDIVLQLFYMEQNEAFSRVTNRAFLRAKWSF